jgi:catechol 2,3-dioxygenase-like lactoylglutathione lyase family enzyme
VSALILSVRDLERSARFYGEVLGLPEVIRDPSVTALGDQQGGSPTIFLRQGSAHGVHAGHDALGVRSLMFDVGSVGELDRIEEALRAWDVFRERHAADTVHRVEVVTGHDPDRNALAFLASAEGKAVVVASLERVPPVVYGIDL